MTDISDPIVQNLISVGGYVISGLLGIVLFLVKRELAHHDVTLKDIQKQHNDDEVSQRNRCDKHIEKFDDKRESLNIDVQRLRAELLGHCAESNERFLTKDEFVSSTTYLTKKTDDVLRLLQSVESILSRR